MLVSKTLADSREPSVVRLASQVLAVIAAQCTSYGDEAPRLLLASHGPELVKVILCYLCLVLYLYRVENSDDFYPHTSRSNSRYG